MVDSNAMAPIPRRMQAIIAAGLVSVLTVSVFVRSQYSGPESAVLRYQLALVQNDAALIGSLVLQGSDSERALYFHQSILVLIAASEVQRIVGVRHMGREAYVDMAYTSRQSGTILVRFFLSKPVDSWKIDAERTRGVVGRARI